MGSLYISFSCLRQTDVKALIAYSSVSHMGILLGGLIVANEFAWGGAILIIEAHGLCSSGLFFLANALYERSFTRRIYLLKGCTKLFPVMNF